MKFTDGKAELVEMVDLGEDYNNIITIQTGQHIFLCNINQHINWIVRTMIQIYDVNVTNKLAVQEQPSMLQFFSTILNTVEPLLNGHLLDPA